MTKLAAQALEELRRIPGVSEANIVTGDHDIMRVR